MSAYSKLLTQTCCESSLYFILKEEINLHILSSWGISVSCQCRDSVSQSSAGLHGARLSADTLWTQSVTAENSNRKQNTTFLMVQHKVRCWNNHNTFMYINDNVLRKNYLFLHFLYGCIVVEVIPLSGQMYPGVSRCDVMKLMSQFWSQCVIIWAMLMLNDHFQLLFYSCKCVSSLFCLKWLQISNLKSSDEVTNVSNLVLNFLSAYDIIQ